MTPRGGGQCVICFESTSQWAALPCACNVEYCTRCWDRALAESFNACDKSRCPTCRGTVRVDFDAEQGCLLFSREEEGLPEPSEAQASQGAAEERAIRAERIFARRKETVDRLLKQARPMQVRLLRRHGEENQGLWDIWQDPGAHLRSLPASELRGHLASFSAVPDLAAAHAEAEAAAAAEGAAAAGPEELAQRLLETVGPVGAVAASWAVVSQVAPSCVCGSFLRRVSGTDRIRKLCEAMFPGAVWDPETFWVVLTTGSCGVNCDICESAVGATKGVWTCENGDSTILHATAYDVCDDCFVAHACHGLNADAVASAGD